MNWPDPTLADHSRSHLKKVRDVKSMLLWDRDVGQELSQKEPTWRRSEEETVVAERDNILADPGTERLVLSVAMEMHRD